MAEEFEEYSLQETANLLITCFEGGSNYWLNGEYKITVVEKFDDKYCGKIPCSVKIKGKEHCGCEVVNEEVNAKTLTEAARKMLSRGVKVSKTIVSDLLERDGCDADAADCLLQVALFGELVYG